MILTGKAKEDFLTYFFKTDKWDKWDTEMEFGNKSDCEESALIVEWLDTVGFYISVWYVDIDNELEKDNGFIYSIISEIQLVLSRSHKNRNKATYNAITKTNEIYNETR